MRRFCLPLLALLALLAACGQEEAAAPFTVDQGAVLAASGAFEQALETVDETMIAPYLGLPEDPEKAVLYTSPDMGYELLAILEMTDETAAQAAQEAAQAHLAAAVEMERELQYRPGDLAKLEQAVIRRQGSTVLYAVCADYDALEHALGT